MTSIILLLLLLITLVIYKYKEYKEGYKDIDIVGYNNSYVIPNEIISIYESETLDLTSVFRNLFNDYDFDTSTYLVYTTYIEFPFNNIIKKIILDYLKENVKRFKKDKIEINSNINHMYWKNIGDDRLFIFNVNLLNSTNFMTRNIKVKILIKNIRNFMNDDNYKTNVPSLTLMLSTTILCIKLDTDNYVSKFSSYTGFDKLDPGYYKIKNALHLTSPFITSSSDLIITNNMKINFQKKLDTNSKILK